MGRYQVCDRDVTDELSKFLVRRGREALADDLYQQEVVTFASSDGESIFVSTESDLIDAKLMEQFEESLYRNWPTKYEGYEDDWKDGSDR